MTLVFLVTKEEEESQDDDIQELEMYHDIPETKKRRVYLKKGYAPPMRKKSPSSRSTKSSFSSDRDFQSDKPKENDKKSENGGHPGFKYQEVVRDKATRKLMHGDDCPCCSDVNQSY